jgi:large subunit ribosomal protein L32
MAVPKKKVSHGRKRRRQSHMAMSKAHWGECPHCTAPKMPHRVCLSCGFYEDREILRERSGLQ